MAVVMSRAAVWGAWAQPGLMVLVMVVVRSGAGGGGHGYGLSSALGRDNIVGFGFGSQIGPWGPFTVYCAASSGAIYSLCPVAPFGELNAVACASPEAGSLPLRSMDCIGSGVSQCLGVGVWCGCGACGVGVAALYDTANPHPRPGG